MGGENLINLIYLKAWKNPGGRKSAWCLLGGMIEGRLIKNLKTIEINQLEK